MENLGAPDIAKLKGNGDIRGLIKALGYAGDYHLRDAAQAALLEIGASAVEPLIAALKDSGWSGRFGAAQVLGKMGDPRALGPLTALLSDKDESMHVAGIGGLGELRDPGGVAPLAALLSDASEDTRRQAALALGYIGHVSAVQPLVVALRDEDSGVRWVSAQQLGRIRDSRAVGPLIDALKDPDSDVRKRAAEALGAIGDARAFGPLTELVNASASDDRDAEWVRPTAIAAMHACRRETQPALQSRGSGAQGVSVSRGEARNSGSRPESCSACGSQIVAGASFCHVCGTQAGGQPRRERQQLCELRYRTELGWLARERHWFEAVVTDGRGTRVVARSPKFHLSAWTLVGEDDMAEPLCEARQALVGDLVRDGWEPLPSTTEEHGIRLPRFHR